MKSLLLMMSLVCMAVGGQTQQAPSVPSPSFEVATVKPNNGTDPLSLVWFGEVDKVTETNVTVTSLIRFAYGLKDGELIGGPPWIDSDRYDIQAKIPDSSVAEFQKDRSRTGEQHRIDQLRVMMRSLLSERFGLVVANQTKALPIFVLAVARNGAKLSAATGRFGMNSSGDELSAYGVGIDVLVDELSKSLSRRVVDETGLRDRYDFVLSWKSDSSTEDTDPRETRIRRALDEQLGLKLDMRKAPVAVVQIEAIHKPSEN